MTTFSKLCPKCQRPCDLAATSCKKCGLKFGAQPVEADAPEVPKEPVLRRPSIVLPVFGILAVIVLIVIAGFVMQFVRDQHTAEVIKKDTEKHSRISAGKD